ncbi:MAG: pseudaminic acid synthase [Clostridium sp.]|jgi:pseudaminic acid synthase|nr:pseudaminic acid synthase [Clostridium sp.]
MKLMEYIASSKVYIIAEMSGNHGGSLAQALEIVQAAAWAGADCLKIQTYTADTITINSHTPPFLVKTGLWQQTYLYDLYQEAFTPWEWHQAIQEETIRCGMDFLSTPFDLSAVDFLEDLGVSMYKIASFEIVDIPLIRKVAATGKPILLSVGMAGADEIGEALDAAASMGNHQVILLKCCSSYPAQYEDMNLSTITDMRERFQVPIGLSDHSAKSLASIAAVALGACVVEKHFCLSRNDKTVDSEFSLNKEEFTELVKDIRQTSAALGQPQYGPQASEAQSYEHRRSLFAVAPIAKGEAFTSQNVRSIRPGCGLHTRYYDTLLAGCYAAKDIPFATPLSEDLIEPNFHVTSRM